MQTTEIICDGCGADLTTRTNCVDYRLVLASESKPGYGSGVYTSMMIYPPVERTHHFCNLGCLDLWRDRSRHYSKLWQEWNDKWQDENGTKDETGRVRSYPCPPQELTDPLKIEFEQVALAAFPMSSHQNRARSNA